MAHAAKEDGYEDRVPFSFAANAQDGFFIKTSFHGDLMNFVIKINGNKAHRSLKGVRALLLRFRGFHIAASDICPSYIFGGPRHTTVMRSA